MTNCPLCTRKLKSSKDYYDKYCYCGNKPNHTFNINMVNDRQYSMRVIINDITLYINKQFHYEKIFAYIQYDNRYKFDFDIYGDIYSQCKKIISTIQMIGVFS